jgi:hypothetical protein
VVEEVDMKSAIRRVAPFPGSSPVPALALGAALTALMAGSWVAGAQPPPPPPGEPEEEAKEMIVMVRGTLGGTPMFGAGIIVGSRSDRLYIATANHVVRKGLNDAEDLRVELRSLPGEAIAANLLEHADESLDLAVLAPPREARWSGPLRWQPGHRRRQASSPTRSLAFGSWRIRAPLQDSRK